MKRKIPDDIRDLSKWNSIADEGDYYCYLFPVSEMDILRQSGLNKVCVHKQNNGSNKLFPLRTTLKIG